MTAEIAAAIEKVEALLSVPERWTKRHFARSARGWPIGPETSGAIRWCIEGAIRKEVGPLEYGLGNSILEWMHQRVGAVSTFNDHSTHPEVLAFLARCREDALNV